MSNTLLLNKRPNVTSAQLHAVEIWFETNVRIAPTGYGERVCDLYSNFVVFLQNKHITIKLSKRLFVKAVLFIVQELKNNPDAYVTQTRERVISHIELN